MYALLEWISSLGKGVTASLVVASLAAAVIAPCVQLAAGGRFKVVRAIGTSAICLGFAVWSLNFYVSSLPAIQQVADKHAPHAAHH